MRQALILAPLLLAGCVSSPPIISAPFDCTTLLPAEWAEGVPSAPFPEEQTVGALIKFGDSQGSQLEKANDHYVAAVGICHRFNERNTVALKRSKPKLFGIF